MGSESRERCGSCNAPLAREGSFCTSCGAPRGEPEHGTHSGPLAALTARLREATSGEYQVLGHLGQGGMGTVFLALDLSLHRHVAIKVMAPGVLHDPTLRERFRTEARIVATLRHPGIINIHRFRIVDDLHFFVMDYIDGPPLRSLIRAKGPLPVDVALAILYDVGSALQHAHSAAHVIHRDIKPGNIIVEPSGRAIVMDFGISKAANATVGFTASGVIVGTPEYMSPEQCRGVEITPASDQYALGLVAYAMLTGAPPFAGQSFNVLMQQTSTEPTPVRDVRPDCPPEVASAVERMLAKSAHDRWPDIVAALRSMGARPLEDGDPLRRRIGEMARAITMPHAAPAPVATLMLGGLPDRTEPGDVVTVAVTPVDGLGRPLPDREVSLESSNPDVLEVISADALRAVRVGSARISAYCGDARVSRALLVAPPSVTFLSIVPTRGTIHVGDQTVLRASVLDRHGTELPDRAVMWASSDPNVANISGGGRMTAVAPGMATVFATCEGLSTTLELHVVSATARAAHEEASEPRPHAGMGSRADSRHRPAGVADSLSRRHLLAFVAVAGLLAAAVGGTWAASHGARSTPPAEALELELPSATSLTLTGDGGPIGAALELRAGDAMDLGVLHPSGEPLTGEGVVEWTTSRADVVDLQPNGRLFAHAPGTATITAAAGDLVRVVQVNVAPTVERLVISSARDGRAAPDQVSLEAGQVLALAASVVDEAGRSVAGDGAVHWGSSDPSTASIDQNGTLLAIAGGTARIFALSPDARDSIDVTVTVVAADAIVLRTADNTPLGETVELDAGGSIPLTVVAIGRDGVQRRNVPASWTTTDPGVADVSANGLLTARGPGRAVLSVDGGGTTKRFTVIVRRAADGFLDLTIRPWAYVYIDGSAHGQDERSVRLSLPAGAHTLRLENPMASVFDTTFVIHSNDTTVIHKVLSPGGGG